MSRKGTTDLPPIALTMGDPAGVGGEITLLAKTRAGAALSRFFVVDDPTRLRRLAARLGLSLEIVEIDDPAEAKALAPEILPVIAEPLPEPPVAGCPNTANAGAVIHAIDRAVGFAADGRAAGVVTNPIQKSALYAAGFSHPGHTEYLAEISGGGVPVMMLACAGLRTVPVTVHLGLRDAIDRLSGDDIVTKSKITAAALERDFGIGRPRLAVAGLNPHAGEDGAMGSEDRDIVEPAVQRLRAEGVEAVGPLPPIRCSVRARERPMTPPFACTTIRP